MLHNMRNDYRVGRSVLHCVVDPELMMVVRASASARGVSITRLVTDLLSDALMDVQPDQQASSPVSAVDRKPDWDSILERGRAGRVVVVPDTVSDVDPLEDIA